MAIGALTLQSGLAYAIPSGVSPYGAVASPDNKNLYVMMYGATSGVGQYAINAATGALSAISGKPTLLSTAANATWGAISPDGKNLYVSVGGGNIYAFTRDTTDGSLTQLALYTTNVNSPMHLAVSPDGAHLYVAMYGLGVVKVYARNATTGALTEVSTNAVAAAHGVTVSPDGKAVYATSASANTIVTFTRDNNPGSGTYGQLTQVGTGQATASNFPDDVIVTDDGKFVYVATDSGSQITCCFSRNPSTNVLTAIANPGAVYQVTAAGPWGIALSKDSKNTALYLAQSDGQRITQFTRDTDPASPTYGQLTLMSPQFVSTSNYNGSTLVSSAGPYAVVVRPDGKFMYATAMSTNKVDVFAIEMPAAANSSSGSKKKGRARGHKRR